MHTPSSHPLSSQEFPHVGVLGGITGRISELLNSEAFLHQSQELTKLFTQLNDALDAKIIIAGYGYRDYEQRLFRQEKDLEAILQQDQALRVLYENLLKAIEFTPYLKQALWDKILFDRVLELGPPAQEFSESDSVSFDELKTTSSIPPYIIIKDLPSEASVQELEEVFLKIENTPGLQIISLSSNNLGVFGQKQLQAIFSHLGNVKSIDLGDNGLGQLDEPRLQAIFSHLGNIRSIDLRNNRLRNLDEPSLQAIFSHLSGAKCIDLRGSYIFALDIQRLQAIFFHLGNVRSIDLRDNGLGDLDEPRLQVIFSHLSGAKSIDLRWNNIFTLGIQRLQAIFSHLGNVRSIDLRGNGLGHLDKPRLHAIFLPLTSLKVVILDSQEEVTRLESLFPHLIGKFKIV